MTVRCAAGLTWSSRIYNQGNCKQSASLHKQFKLFGATRTQDICCTLRLCQSTSHSAYLLHIKVVPIYFSLCFVAQTIVLVWCHSYVLKMSDPFPLPDKMEFTGNVAENWRLFEQMLGYYLDATGKAAKADKIKIGVLMSAVGKQGVHIFNAFKYNEGESADKFDDVIKKFKDYCMPKKNVTYERFVFNQMIQESGESAETFVTRLNNQAKYCDFGSLETSLVKDRIVVGCLDARVKGRMLRDGNLDYDKAFEALKSAEIVDDQSRMMGINYRPAETETVHRIGQKDSYISDCMFCGGSHMRKKCPAYNETCRNCGEKGHYAKKCDSRVNKPPKNEAKCCRCACGEQDKSVDDKSEGKFVRSIDHTLIDIDSLVIT